MYSHVNQKPAELPALAEVRRETYLHNLAKLAVVGLVLGLAFLLLWSFITAPRFDENYVRNLLARHDPILARAALDGMATEEPDGLSTFSQLKTVTYVDANMLPAAKEVEIVAADGGNIIEGSMVTFSSVPVQVSTPKSISRSWRCPGNTEYSTSVEETSQYLYIGIENTYLPYLQIQEIINEPGGLNASIEPSWNESWNADVWRHVQNAAPWIMRMSEVYYYNPSERSEFDAKLAEVSEITEACEEIV